MPYQRLQHHDPMKWKKKFKMLFDRERIIDFGMKHKTQIDLRKFSFNPDCQVLRPIKPLGQDILTMAKFWILYLTLTMKPNSASPILERGLSELASYGVEDSCDNRIVMAEFLPEDVDEAEVMADSFLLEKWQEHIKNITTDSPNLKSYPSAKFLETVSQNEVNDQDMGGETEKAECFNENVIEGYELQGNEEMAEVPCIANLADFADQQIIHCVENLLLHEMKPQAVESSQQQKAAAFENPFALYESIGADSRAASDNDENND